jgi:hypothetical protein
MALGREKTVAGGGVGQAFCRLFFEDAENKDCFEIKMVIGSL